MGMDRDRVDSGAEERIWGRTEVGGSGRHLHLRRCIRTAVFQPETKEGSEPGPLPTGLGVAVTQRPGSGFHLPPPEARSFAAGDCHLEGATLGLKTQSLDSVISPGQQGRGKSSREKQGSSAAPGEHSLSPSCPCRNV